MAKCFDHVHSSSGQPNYKNVITLQIYKKLFRHLSLRVSWSNKLPPFIIQRTDTDFRQHHKAVLLNQ